MTKEEIKQLRTDIGRSQEQFAVVVGTTGVTVGRWERGVSVPMPFFMDKLEKLKKFTYDKETREKRKRI